MNNRGFAIFFAAFFILIGGIVGYGIRDGIAQRYESQLYPRTMRVIEVDRRNDSVLLEDSVGFAWEFLGTEDWCVGDCASVILNSRGTDIIFDDEIVSVRYSAWDLERSD